jgi:hypothetical protein
MRLARVGGVWFENHRGLATQRLEPFGEPSGSVSRGQSVANEAPYVASMA